MFFTSTFVVAAIAAVAVSSPVESHQPSKPTSAEGPHVLAAGGRVSNPKLQTTSINLSDGVGAGVDKYVFYQGDGTTGAGWPDKSKWVSYIDMFNYYKPTMKAQCSDNSQAPDSGPEVGALWNAINQTALETLVDHRFILAIIMQESGGCVRVNTTFSDGISNPGLMQSFDGPGKCNDNHFVQNPCPASTILQMVRDGTAGTPTGDGLAQALNQAGASDVSAWYKAARIYNSGSLASNGDLGAKGSTRCYSSDIANRLTGWLTARKTCNLDPF